MARQANAAQAEQVEYARLIDGDWCWLCGLKATRICQTCTATSCQHGCPCMCREAVSAAMRYWLDGSSTVHVMVDVGQPDLASCGKRNETDWRGKHLGSFHKAPPAGKARCHQCFSPTPLATEPGWGAEDVAIYVEGQPSRARAVVGADGIRRWKFTQDTSQVPAILRASAQPTPLEIRVQDADAMMPYVAGKLDRIEHGIRSASERMLAAYRLAQRLKGKRNAEARIEAMTEANAALADLHAIYAAQEAEQSAARAYADVLAS